MMAGSSSAHVCQACCPESGDGKVCSLTFHQHYEYSTGAWQSQNYTTGTKFQ